MINPVFADELRVAALIAEGAVEREARVSPPLATPGAAEGGGSLTGRASGLTPDPEVAEVEADLLRPSTIIRIKSF